MALEARANGELTLGSVLFNWRPEAWRDFYVRIAEEAPVDIVYLGEVVCSKRAPFFEPLYEAVAHRLARAGKKVVFSTLAQVMVKQDRRVVEGVTALDARIEANDVSALGALTGRPHHIGPHLNVYNEGALAVLARGGAVSVCAPVEMPASALAKLAAAAAALGVCLEVQVFGRMSLALSARCYHARAHGRTKDSCLFVCDKDADGMELTTLDGKPFLTVNGIQTMSQGYLSLAGELDALRGMGVSRLRLSPQACDMVEIARVFRDALDRRIDREEAHRRLAAASPAVPFSNGFFHRKAGAAMVRPGTA